MTSASAAAPIADRDGDGRRFATAAAPEHDVASGSAGNGNAAADWLSLAAAPTFASMALLTGVSSGGPSHMLCLAGQEASPLSGMALMYLLMSAFHSAPWLKLIARRRS